MRTLLVCKLPSTFPALFRPVLWPVPWPVRVRSGAVRVACSKTCLELVEDLLCSLFRGLLEPACRSLHRISRLDIDVLSSRLPVYHGQLETPCRAGSFQLNSLLLFAFYYLPEAVLLASFLLTASADSTFRHCCRHNLQQLKGGLEPISAGLAFTIWTAAL